MWSFRIDPLPSFLDTLWPLSIANVNDPLFPLFQILRLFDPFPRSLALLEGISISFQASVEFLPMKHPGNA